MIIKNIEIKIFKNCIPNQNINNLRYIEVDEEKIKNKENILKRIYPDNGVRKFNFLFGCVDLILYRESYTIDRMSSWVDSSGKEASFEETKACYISAERNILSSKKLIEI